MSRADHMRLCGTPDEEFANEARICGRYAGQMMADGEWTAGRADDSIYRDALRMSAVYGLNAVRFIEIAEAARLAMLAGVTS